MPAFLAAVPWVITGAAWGLRAIQVARAARTAVAASRAVQAAQAVAASERARATAAGLARATAQAQALAQSKAREEVCDDCSDTVPCFNKPDGVSDEEFEKQLQEQEDTINNTTADKILERRQAIRDAGGTGGVRDHQAQQNARRDYLDSAAERGQSLREAEEAARGLDATHALDIIAGGDPSDISGLQDRSVNRSLGSQWRGERSQALEDEAQRMHDEGKGQDKMKVKLKKC